MDLEKHIQENLPDHKYKTICHYHNVYKITLPGFDIAFDVLSLFLKFAIYIYCSLFLSDCIYKASFFLDFVLYFLYLLLGIFVVYRLCFFLHMYILLTFVPYILMKYSSLKLFIWQNNHKSTISDSEERIQWQHIKEKWEQPSGIVHKSLLWTLLLLCYTAIIASIRQ